MTQDNKLPLAPDKGILTVGIPKFVIPLEIRWDPKEDITVNELALCLPILIWKHPIMPYDIDITLPHFRHFIIINHNKD